MIVILKNRGSSLSSIIGHVGLLSLAHHGIIQIEKLSVWVALDVLLHCAGQMSWGCSHRCLDNSRGRRLSASTSTCNYVIIMAFIFMKSRTAWYISHTCTSDTTCPEYIHAVGVSIHTADVTEAARLENASKDT